MSWQCIGASAPGLRHQTEGVPCQDALGFFATEHLLVAVIADGAGSAARARDGSQTLVEATLSQAKNLFAQGLPARPADLRTQLYRLLARTRAVVDTYADTEGAPVRDFASTIAVVVADVHRLGAIQVGDGGIVVLRGDGTLEQIAYPEQPEFVNETTFLTSADWRGAAACHVEENADIVAVGLTTDGLVPVATARPEGTPHGPFFRPLFAFAASPTPAQVELDSFLRSDRVQTATGDDVTILLGHRGIR